MCVKASSELLQLENWLSLLIATYQEHPSCGLAKIINYYIERLSRHDDMEFCGKNSCEYLGMKKFWQWQAQH